LQNILKVHGFGHPNFGRWIGRIRNDTLVLWGDQDRMLPPGQAKIWAGRIPHARIYMVHNAGHFAMQDQPACLNAIADFLSA
jgi:pimeloyl-ACP methyl ester carboxylesterase